MLAHPERGRYADRSERQFLQGRIWSEMGDDCQVLVRSESQLRSLQYLRLARRNATATYVGSAHPERYNPDTWTNMPIFRDTGSARHRLICFTAIVPTSRRSQPGRLGYVSRNRQRSLSWEGMIPRSSRPARLQIICAPCRAVWTTGCTRISCSGIQRSHRRFPLHAFRVRNAPYRESGPLRLASPA